MPGWGRIAEDGWGKDYDAAIYCRDQALKRVIVQRNYMHHPRSNSNNWRQTRTPPGRPPSSHPEGPQTVVFWDSEGCVPYMINPGRLRSSVTTIPSPSD
jgi:hypothetical protein